MVIGAWSTYLNAKLGFERVDAFLQAEERVPLLGLTVEDADYAIRCQNANLSWESF
jgi:hypothetical protein